MDTGWMGGWVDGWMGGWMDGKAGLRIAYSNQKYVLTIPGRLCASLKQIVAKQTNCQAKLKTNYCFIRSGIISK